MTPAITISKKRRFVADGVFEAELNEFLMNTLSEDGYAGVEVRVTPLQTEIIIRATNSRQVLGEKGRRIRELTSMVQKRFHERFKDDVVGRKVQLFAEKVADKRLCAMVRCNRREGPRCRHVAVLLTGRFSLFRSRSAERVADSACATRKGVHAFR
eukprot:GHVU01206885.1.p1 GENE.GHVU01206885.1~~GHVU01206885.1.p1  ORF type:complete len:177 (-),score=15.31 GHVU01206885.1:233-700(-)